MDGINLIESFAEFKEFILKGNVLDLAVAVIIAGAFAVIVASLTNDLIMPLVGAIFGDVDFSSKYTVLSGAELVEPGMSLEAARDAGATPVGVLRYVTLPILYPGLIAVALFGLTLSYDEFPRSLLAVGSKNTLPIHIATLTSNVTTPALYAIGTLTTALSLGIIILAFSAIGASQRKPKK